MIHVIATIDAKPDCKQAILTELLAIRPEVLLEDIANPDFSPEWD